MTPTLEGSVHTCPYCEIHGRTADNLSTWRNRSVTSGLATRWTRCEVCYAMWREVWDWDRHVFVYQEHWKPRS